MGFIADRVKASTPPASPAVRGSTRSLWRETFGNHATDKETSRPSHQNQSTLTSTNEALKRLLVSMRSRAPGGWSDDRWEQSRHFVGISYVAIHRQNEMLTEAEFQVFEKDPSHPEGKRPAESSEAADLIELLTKPNPDDNFGDLMAQWNLQQELTGTALTWMVPNQLGKPYELYPIPTAIVIPGTVVNEQYPQGYYRVQPVYPYGPFSTSSTPLSSVGAIIPAEWMMRFKYPHPLLRYDGYSPQTALRLHLDEIESMDRSRWYAMKKGSLPDAVLQMDDMEGVQPLTDDEILRIKAEYENEMQGPENHGRLYVAAPGTRLEPWGHRPIDMDYQSGWEQLVSFALGGFGITKPAAGMVDDSSYSTLFATLKQLYWLTLEPKAARIGRKLTRVLAPYFGDNLIIEVRCKRIDDHDIKFARVDKAMSGKAITKNELRKELDWPTTDEEWGDEIAGTDSQEQQGMMPGMAPEGMPGTPEQQGQPVDQAPQNENAGLEALLAEDEEVEKERPRPGKLSEGALGPRKSLDLNSIGTKSVDTSLYSRIRKVIANGHQ